ncbi:MAG: efflux RND transporter periplasmic adaptor subunit [Ignavibacteriae bacterium]|nr:efflux RND transporter periplasmic adaptor subunit [Ignavibacteriota bacterium]
MNKKLIIILSSIVILGIGGVVLYPKLFPTKQERKVLYWTDPMIPGYKSPTPGKSPMGMEMIPVYEDDTLAQRIEQHEEPTAGDEIDYYTCTMHPSVKERNPGRCPICNMDLTPVMKKAKAAKEKVDLTFSVSPTKQQLIGVKFAEVKKLPLDKVIRAVGRVDYDERKVAVVNLRISGWIQDLFADYTGKFVQKGQPLFKIYSPELVSAQQEYLLALQTQQETTWTVETTQEGKTLLETVRERLRLFGITDEQISAIEKRRKPETYLTIYSPLSGNIVEKMVLEGMRVEPGMTLYKIADLSTIWVYADVYEYELPYVKTGQEAVVTLSSYPNEIFKGRIMYIYPFLTVNTRTVKVRIEIPNPHGKLKPEMYGNVELHIRMGNRLVVPQSAVLNTGERQIVFIDKGDGLFEVRFVKLGTRSEDMYEVIDGLETGERVVSSANFLIDAESKVQGVLQRLEAPESTTSKQMPRMEHKH